MQNNHLDIIIEYINEEYKATCTTFPTCKGVGQTEEEALDKLSQAIGNFVGRKTKTYLSKVIQNKNYRHHVIDPFEKQTQYRLYPYQPEKLPFSHAILIKLQDLLPETTEPTLQNMDASDLIYQDQSATVTPDIYPEEGYMLGLSLSLN